MRSTCSSNEYLNPIRVNIGVIGLSGTSQVKGVSGIGKSSICNRLVRPHQYNKQISTLTTVDFYSDIINGSHWIYWDHVIKTIDSKSYAFHVIEQTILINDQTYAPFENFTESEYISRAISGKLSGSKRAYISPSQFSKPQECEATLITDDTVIDAFVIVYDVSEVISRNYEAQDRYVTEILNSLHKIKKPLIIVTSKTDIASQKIRSRLDTILDKRNFKAIPLVQTSAKLNINISVILTFIGNLLNANQKTLSFNSIKSSTVKFESYECAAKKHQQVVDELLESFQHLVECGTNKYYDISWADFCAENELTRFLGDVDRTVLRQRFQIYQSSAIANINEIVTNLFVVLFKKLIFEYVDRLLVKYDGDNKNIVNDLLKNSEFLSHFNVVDLSYNEIMKNAHLHAQIDYPLPKCFIDFESPYNKLNIIELCIEEIKYQKRQSDFTENFLSKLVANSDLYIDLKFSDVEKQFKDEQLWNNFRLEAKSIFQDFVEAATKEFKEVFDERLLELSFMIFSIGPVKINFLKDSKKKRLPAEDTLDMSQIQSIDNKIFFENYRFNKAVFRSHRLKWIVKYIGSILSTNPNQCYIFDFQPDLCCEHLEQYLKAISKNLDSLLVIVSGDEMVDQFWRESIINNAHINTVESCNILPSEIQFYSSTDLKCFQFWEKKFPRCQKIVFLVSEDTINSHNILKRLINEEIASKVQLSVINTAKFYSSFNENYIDEYCKKCNIEYNNVGWSLCPNHHLIKLLNDQSNAYLFNSKPIIIWIVVLCADTYNTDVPLSFIMSTFEDYIITDRNVINGLLSISLYYIYPTGELPHKISISIVSYHQAFKWLTEENQLAMPNLLVYFCNMLRLASINTMFAVMQNIFTSVHIKSIMCAISCSTIEDPVEFIEKKCIVKELSVDIGVDLFLIDDNKKFDKLDIQKMRRHIHNCTYPMNIMDKNKNLCCYNNAFVNEDIQNISRFKIYIESSNSVQSKDYVDYLEPNAKEVKAEQRLFGNSKHLLSCSNSPNSSDSPLLDTLFRSDKIKKKIDVNCLNEDYTFPLGFFNEERFLPITEESKFDESNDIEDKITAVVVNCANSDHTREENSDRSKLSKDNRKLPLSKIRSYSGPVQPNKSFSKKYSTPQGLGSRSQRFTKKSQSLTTSPLTPGVKQLSLCEICKAQRELCICCEFANINCGEVSTVPTTKSFKNILSRIFSSERYTGSKSAEERRSLFRRSFKFSKRNSDRKTKAIPTKSGSDPQPSSTISDSACLPLSHSNSHSILDLRKKSKPIWPMKNP